MCRRKGRIAGFGRIARRIVVGLGEGFESIVPCLKLDSEEEIVSNGWYLKEKVWVVVIKLERVT